MTTEFVDDGNTPTYKSAAWSGIDWAALIVLLVSSGTSASLPAIPIRRPTGGTSFRILSAHDSFVVSTMFAFTSALTAMLLNGKSKAAKFFRYSAIMNQCTALLLLAHAIETSMFVS